MELLALTKSAMTAIRSPAMAVPVTAGRRRLTGIARNQENRAFLRSSAATAKSPVMNNVTTVIRSRATGVTMRAVSNQAGLACVLAQLARPRSAAMGSSLVTKNATMETLDPSMVAARPAS
jgi:hypothetical protein